MYTTIEAEIENGQVIGAEALELPEHAHVLITLLSEQPRVVPEQGSVGTLRGALKKFANSELVAEEGLAWGQAAECKHEAD